MTYDTYIFDLDGTLLDTLNDLAAAVNYALRSHEMPEHSLDDVRRFVGNGVRKLMERAVPDGTENPDFDATFATFRQYYMAHSLDTTRPYEGIPETLAALKARGCRLAVVSNKMMAATQELCQHFFPDTIEVAIGENEAAGIRKKPAPDTVFAALNALNALGSPRSTLGYPRSNIGHPRQSSAVYVGDSDVDIETARHAGIPCISVLWGFRDRDFLIKHGAKTFISAPSELLSL
jgi:phosphoglycolate phosphatase